MNRKAKLLRTDIQNQSPPPVSTHEQVGGNNVSAKFSHLQIFQSKLPPTHELKGMEQIHPGTLDRLLSMQERELTLLEDQVRHRHDLETTVIKSGVIAQNRGAWFGFILVFVVLGVVAFGYKLGITSASWLGVSAIASITGAFVYATWSNSKERLKRMVTMITGTPRENKHDE